MCTLFVKDMGAWDVREEIFYDYGMILVCSEGGFEVMFSTESTKGDFMISIEEPFNAQCVAEELKLECLRIEERHEGRHGPTTGSPPQLFFELGAIPSYKATFPVVPGFRYPHVGGDFLRVHLGDSCV